MCEQCDSPEDALEHHGVKGMKWGIRNDKPGGSSSSSAAPEIPAFKQVPVEFGKDGSISIKKGGELQRVVRKTDGISFKAASDVSDVTYASFSEVDNLRYQQLFGRRQSIFTKQASQILTLTAQTDLKSPGPKDSAALFFNSLKKNPEAFAELNSKFRDKNVLGYDKQTLAKAMKNPTARSSFDLYAHSFELGNYGKGTSIANKAFLDEVQKAGYNMLLDPSDSAWGVSDTPVIILGGRKSVDVTGRREVDKLTKKYANKRLAELEREIDDGKTYLEKLGYEI